MIHFTCKADSCQTLLIDGWSPTRLEDILDASGYGEVVCYKCNTKHYVSHTFLRSDVYTEAEFLRHEEKG